MTWRDCELELTDNAVANNKIVNRNASRTRFPVLPRFKLTPWVGVSRAPPFLFMMYYDVINLFA